MKYLNDYFVNMLQQALELPLSMASMFKNPLHAGYLIVHLTFGHPASVKARSLEERPKIDQAIFV